MVRRFLITTADERTWRFDRPALFLGEWCRLYGRRSVWENLDSEVVPYHWDDRSKLYRDYLYLKDLYEKLLTDLSEALNQFHGVKHSKRYWRTLVGPWLGYFTQMLFDRWTMIQQAVHNFQIGGSAMLALTPERAIPNDMNDFIAKFVDDPWNSFIYGQILTNWTDVPCRQVGVQESQTAGMNLFPVETPKRSFFRRFKSGIARKMFGTSFLSRQTDAVFISSYLPLLTDFRLQVSLGQVPKRWKSPAVPLTRPDLREREFLILMKPGQEGFEHCVRSLIPKQIPTSYLEGFGQLLEIVNTLPWPQRPKVIFTSNSHKGDDVFKAWGATKVENGAPLIIGQHGGHAGAGLWFFNEKHEMAIADRYLTWGWHDGNEKHHPTGSLKLMGIRATEWNRNGGILLVTGVGPRYSYHMYSSVVASQQLDYFQDQFRFVAALPDRLKTMLFVRLSPIDFGWAEALRWKDRYPNVRLAPGAKPMKALIRKSRIFVATYNGTTFLETLGQNIPTIMFWNPTYWELRPSAKPYFDQLKQVGIFHESPESAATKIAEVWDDVAGWWRQPEIQEARRYFCDRFVRMPEKPIRVLRAALTTVGNNKKS